jgi:predicted metal-dependent phosphoesterase TrpH
MLRVEFHCHTVYSKDSLVSPQQLVEACRKKGIDRVVVTDHNAIEGALIAQELDPERVIVGEEIMTTRGELLAAYVKEVIPRGLAPMEAIDRLRAQGAFISVSHPFDQRRGWLTPDLISIVPYVDAIETYNARCLNETPNRQAQAFAAQYHLAGTAGSDAHIAWELGKANLHVPEFENPTQLKEALSRAVPVVGLSGQWVHFMSYYARIRKGFK